MGSATLSSSDIKLDREPWALLQKIMCNAKNCTSVNSNKRITLFPFPDDEDRCQEWVKRSQNEALVDISTSELCQKAHLCAKHFDESQFVDAMKETLVENALPSMFPQHFVCVPSVTPSSQEDWTGGVDVSLQIVKNEPLFILNADENEINTTSSEEPSDLTYQKLCEHAAQVKLPSSLWAVHRGVSNESVAFVHTNISDPFIGVDKAMIFNKTCRADIYFQGQRILLGMGKVATLTEIETLLIGLNNLNIQQESSS